MSSIALILRRMMPWYTPFWDSPAFLSCRRLLSSPLCAACSLLSIWLISWRRAFKRSAFKRAYSGRLCPLPSFIVLPTREGATFAAIMSSTLASPSGVPWLVARTST